MLVMEQEDSVGGRMTVEVASGSYVAAPAEMGERSLKQIPIYSQECGGAGISDDGYAYAALGGGIKRWRHPKAIGGQYYNVVSDKDRDVFIESSNHVAIAERVTIYEEILGELPPSKRGRPGGYDRE